MTTDVRSAVWTRDALLELDREDPLAYCRERFVLPEGLLYFDGNSLGPLTHTSRRRVREVTEQQWGRDLIGSWNQHDWIHLPLQVGAKIAGLIGAEEDEVVVADSISVNLFKLLASALELRPGRRTILSDTANFPTDLYMAQGLAQLEERVRLRRVAPDELITAIDSNTAVVTLSHVEFKTGELRDMAAIQDAARENGALVIWDLAHSAGALEVDLDSCGADFAVGCGYKFLNGGPGAPAFIYVARRLHQRASSPLFGWFGHRDPFAFDTDYVPADGVQRFQCGTPPIVSLAALDAALDTFQGVDLAELRRKSMKLGDLFLDLVEQECSGFGLEIGCPRDAERRGSQVSLRHPQGYAIVQALIERGVVGDFRAPDVLRFGITPLYQRYVDVWDVVVVLRKVMETEAFEDSRYRRRGVVT